MGGSVAPRFMECPGSVALCDGFQSYPTEETARGTVAHAVLHDVVKDWCHGDTYSVYQHFGEVREADGHSFRVDNDMLDAVAVAAHRFTQVVHKALQRKIAGVRYGSELSFHCKQLHPFYWGACDLWMQAGKLLYVADYKHGAGVLVEPKDNWQLLYYAVGLVETLSLWDVVKTIRLEIIQPRYPHDDGPVRSWTLSMAQVATAHRRLTRRMHGITKRAVTDLNAGKWCQFCPAAQNNVCPEIEKMQQRAAAIDFDDHDAPQVDKLAEGLDLADVLKPWCSKVHQSAYTAAKHGRIPKGWKLVQKGVRLRWSDERKAAEVLGGIGYIDREDLFKPETLRTPTTVRQALVAVLGVEEADAIMASISEKSSSGTVLVREDDKREAVLPDAVSDFDDLGVR